MARIRTIKPEFFTSSDIVMLRPLSRLFYVSLWCEADREGRFKWDTQTLKFRYFPAEDCDINEMAEELISAGLIVIYTVAGKEYAEIPMFKHHQVINNKESASIIPPRVKDALKARESGVQGEGKEGKEGKGKEVASNANFDDFWKLYPKKTSKADAEKAWSKIKPDMDLLDKILKAVCVASRSQDWIKDAGQFIPHAATWLNGRRWDDIPTALSVVAKSGKTIPPDHYERPDGTVEHVRFKGAK